MGLKSGSRDAGLDEDEDESEREEIKETEAEMASDSCPELTTTDTTAGTVEPSEQEESTETSDTSSSTDRPSMSSIPYKLRRNKVNEGREQVPYFLREEVIDDEDELQDTLEEMLGETVYKSDYREASMVVAQRNPDLVAEVLREWGYDLEGE